MGSGSDEAAGVVFEEGGEVTEEEQADAEVFGVGGDGGRQAVGRGVGGLFAEVDGLDLAGQVDAGTCVEVGQEDGIDEFPDAVFDPGDVAFVADGVGRVLTRRQVEPGDPVEDDIEDAIEAGTVGGGLAAGLGRAG